MEIEELVKEARALIGQKYQNWGYHNLDHFDETVEAVRKLESKLSRRDWWILMIATVFHDVFKGYGAGEDEKMSAAMARSWMTKQKSFSVPEMDLVEEMIMGTVAVFTPEWQMHQAAESSEKLMVRLMADVDLVNMGVEWDRFESRLKGLWSECGRGADEVREMWQHQKIFFENRDFLTSQVREIAPYLKENKQRVNDILAK